MVTDGKEFRRHSDLLQLPAAVESIVTDCQEGCRQVDAAYPSAFLERTVADMLDGGRNMYLVQERDPVLFRDLAPERAIFRHVVLKGEDIVANDAGALPDGHFVRKVLCIQKLFAVSAVTAVVVAVPIVGPQVLLCGISIDGQCLAQRLRKYVQFFFCHVGNF